MPEDVVEATEKPNVLKQVASQAADVASRSVGLPFIRKAFLHPKEGEGAVEHIATTALLAAGEVFFPSSIKPVVEGAAIYDTRSFLLDAAADIVVASGAMAISYVSGEQNWTSVALIPGMLIGKNLFFNTVDKIDPSGVKIQEFKARLGNAMKAFKEAPAPKQ